MCTIFKSACQINFAVLFVFYCLLKGHAIEAPKKPCRSRLNLHLPIQLFPKSLFCVSAGLGENEKNGENSQLPNLCKVPKQAFRFVDLLQIAT